LVWENWNGVATDVKKILKICLFVLTLTEYTNVTDIALVATTARLHL